ncbi:MAG: hypothetical protein KDE27_30335 [Planctomycetes bacterium]|nr:hypothetical protein [Planctomycetota bacterium]
MNHAAGLALVLTLSSLSAQGIQLATVNEAADPYQNHFWSYNGTDLIPNGPVAFPLSFGDPFLGSLDLRATATSVNAAAWSRTGPSFSILSRSTTDLVTYVRTASPARIRIAVDAQLVSQSPWPAAVPIYDCGVDVDNDGVDEFSNVSPNSSAAVLTTWCDDVGTPVRWHQHNEGVYQWYLIDATSTLDLQFDDPVQEQTYGPSCAGKLGCQLGAAPSDRVFVASLPGDVEYAWLLGGDTPWNVTFQGFSCPLLVEPQFVLAVPTFDGPNGRRYVDFAAAFPPIPGLVFYAQGIAISNDTFVGTNGVIVRT